MTFVIMSINTELELLIHNLPNHDIMRTKGTPVAKYSVV
jgi:hypothetical protein